MSTSPKRGAILIGTSGTLGVLKEQMKLLPSAPAIVGMVVADEAEAPTTPPDSGEAWTSLEGLSDLIDRHRPQQAIVSLPAASAAAAKRALATLERMGVACRVIPPLEELLEGSSPAPRTLELPTSIDMTTLIGRTPYGIDRREVAGLLEGKRVLVTGAGGSIGSEIVRIVATFKPSKIILMERSENALFEIDRQLATHFPGVPRRALLHDVVDEQATLRHVVELKPDIVFHAAAHKHVPLMEDHPAAAVNNNLFGTKSIADAALAVGVKRFVLISSDKAVNPTSVMGATKRLAEMYVQSLQRQAALLGQGESRFAMVRFGNVLGSACSVLPIWASQLAHGGPVTVTDERMTRYFMTIHEAATLVIQAAALTGDAKTAPVYVLDMGEPLKIMDLAQRFVRLNGFEPRRKGEKNHSARDIEIVCTGARPGEKIHEELAYAAESLRPTSRPGINAWAGALEQSFNPAAMIADLSALRGSSDRQAVVSAIRRHVPEMHLPPGGSARAA